jgi:hypothetical protein
VPPGDFCFFASCLICGGHLDTLTAAHSASVARSRVVCTTCGSQWSLRLTLEPWRFLDEHTAREAAAEALYDEKLGR